MKRWIILATLVVLLSGAATVAVQYLPGLSETDGSLHPAPVVDAGPLPEAVVDSELTFKFDSKAQHEQFDHTWTIKNKGDGDLVLHLQSTTCSCTVAEFPAKSESNPEPNSITVKPGAETALHLTFDTKDFEGHYLKSATVGTNDPKRPTIVFATEGSVNPAIIMKPTDKAITFASIANDVESSQRIALYSPDRPELKITKVTSSRPDLVVAEPVPLNSLDRIALKTKGGWRLTVHVKPGMPLGQFHETIVLKTDHPKQSEVQVQIVGNVVGAIAARPASLEASNISGKKGGYRTITLSVAGLRETKFQVEKAPKKLQVAVTPADPNKKDGRYTLTVTVPPGTPPGQIEDNIILKTDHPKADTVKIPVNVLVNGPS